MRTKSVRCADYQAQGVDVDLARGVLGFPSMEFCAAAQFDLRTAMRPFNLLSGGELARAQVACLLTEAPRYVHSLVPSLFPQERAQTWIGQTIDVSALQIFKEDSLLVPNVKCVTAHFVVFQRT